MHMRVNESRNDESAAPVDSDGAGIRVPNSRVLATREHAPVADQQTAVFVAHHRARITDVERKRIVRCVKNGGAEKLHYLSASRRTCRMAKNTRSGVAGLSNANGSPSPNAPIASRSASRTENASISGGSPTALLPITTSGWRAASISTLNVSGTSDHDGSL